MSEFTRTINANGTLTLDNYTNTVNVQFNYTEDTPPTGVNFSFTDLTSKANVSGLFANDKIDTYQVNNGVVDSQFLTVLQTKLADILKNYKTV